jgi:GNAT superfamily N-acetyltransferase
MANADVSPLPALVRRLADEGISISTLAEERLRDPRCVQKLYELETVLREDDPARSQLALPAYNAREALMWLEMPYVIPDAYFIAKHGDEYIGVSDVSLFEAMPGGLTHGFTGVRRDYRRRGLATALKLNGIIYAQTNGYGIIQSFNRPQQTAIRALNEKLEFKLTFESLMLETCLRTVVAVDPRVYDEFIGQYHDDKRPDLDIIVRNEARRLTLECIGQKVELFPTSETTYFIKQFYGEVAFHRDERGNVDYLDFEMRVPNSAPSEPVHALKIA